MPPGGQNPACLPCRRRKSRCKVEPSQPNVCLMCRSHGTECAFATPSAVSSPQRNNVTGRRRAPSITQRRIAQNMQRASGNDVNLIPTGWQAGNAGPPNQYSSAASLTGSVPGRLVSQPVLAHGSSTWSGLHRATDRDGQADETPESLDSQEDDSNQRVIGPALNGDSHLLAQYLPSPPGGTRHTRTVWPVTTSMVSAPIVFTKARKRPLGLNSAYDPAREKLQLIQKLLEPLLPELVNL